MDLKAFSDKIADIIDNVKKSVVTITTVRVALDVLFGLTPIQGVGSGFVVNERGFIVTNSHVIRDAQKVTVILPDGESIEGDVIASDPRRDLALLRVDVEGLKPIKLGDSDNIRVGEIVFAIGSPLGLPGSSVTMGIISAVNRTIVGEDIVLEDLIQTDAAINPGNSGGPLVNVEGEAIGIATAIIPYAQGIGFAIPINTVKRFLEMIARFGRPVMVWIGVYVAPINRYLAKVYRLPLEEGLVVVDVVRGGPAYRVGIRKGDIIMKANNRKVGTAKDLRSAVEDSVSRGYVVLEIFREGRVYEVEVPIAIEAL
ncbi:MAG: trypsin-like peptidase domain-containing protein [Desulfurococcaceae archaeon]|jgi:S1-C subfamily serine protease|nr:trypsin-like peptidase domain-containing protein [Desulfurococcaceae archaeon]MCC6057501.1 trypsin-like peptidase domain-containing protein [Desulfurococcaceae archaeon]